MLNRAYAAHSTHLPKTRLDTVRAGSVLELDVSLNSVSCHKEFRKETGKHGQIIILGQFEISEQRFPLANAISLTAFLSPVRYGAARGRLGGERTKHIWRVLPALRLAALCVSLWVAT